MRFSVITIFPEFFDSPLSCGLLSKAREKGLVEFAFLNPRYHSTDRHRNVDDRPYGGGPGMVMAVDPLRRALATLSPKARVVMLSPKGRPLTQALARELAGEGELALLCGRYEGFDARLEELCPIEAVSVGDFVLNGGETAALCLIEAVGRRWYPTYFRSCADLLHERGAMLLQAIVVDDRHFDHDARHVDFIKRYIFPGGVLPSVGVIARTVAEATDLQIGHLRDLTDHYATTLEIWRGRLLAARDAILALGRDERTLRCWEFYFAYCEGGFRERRIGDVQMLLVKPGCDLPLLRTPVDERSAAWARC